MSSLLIAPIEALTDSRLTDPERRVLLALFSFRGKDTNTVWPALPTLGKVALVNDPARVSKLTSSLAEKGWLTKKKKGFTGGNEYHLTVPPEASSEHAERIVHDANLAPETKLAGNTNTNLASETKSNLVPETKYKEQTIDHTSEHKTPPVSPLRGKTRQLPADFTLTPTLRNRAEAYWASKQRTDLDADDEFELFTAHHRGRGTRAADWDATWQTWYGNAVRFNRKPRENTYAIREQPRRESRAERADREYREALAIMDARDRAAGAAPLAPDGGVVHGQVVVEHGQVLRR